MEKGENSIVDRHLFPKIEVDIKKHPEKYRDAGKWLDEFYDIENFWERRKQELSTLKNFAKWHEDNEAEIYKIKYLESMIDLKVYIPIESRADFSLMTHSNTEMKPPQIKLKTRKKINELLAVLDLGEEEQERWVFENLPAYRDSDLSLGAFAYILREAMMGEPELPPIETVRKLLENWRKVEKEPAMLYRFRDAQNALLWKCCAQDFMDTENARRVFLMTWLFTDPRVNDAEIGITKFENWPWNRGLRGRDIVYYETFIKDCGETGNKWMKLVHAAWAKFEAEKEFESEKPAETGRNAAPAKYQGIRAWLWKLYEKTLKVIVDAVMEKMWHG
ncbi:hypothetical protein ES707_07888 [subsurface metagenome]